jgi:hypothetical protein
MGGFRSIFTFMGAEPEFLSSSSLDVDLDPADLVRDEDEDEEDLDLDLDFDLEDLEDGEVEPVRLDELLSEFERRFGLMLLLLDAG